MLFSVIIPTCNRNESLSKCLDLLAPDSQTIAASEYEVIVTDDSSGNVAKRLIEEEYTWAKWIAGPGKGPAANRNNGAENSTGDWLVFIDDDCLPDKNILLEYYNATIQYKEILVFEGCIKVDRAQRNFLEESPVNESGGYLWSCNFSINKTLFIERLHGFDEKFPHASMEDVDLYYRLQKEGFKAVFLRNASVIHPWRIQKKLFSVTIKRFNSTLYFLEKHPERKKDINAYAYLRFYYNFIRNTARKALHYHFRGFMYKIVQDFMHLYFALVLFIRDCAKTIAIRKRSRKNITVF